MVFLSKIPSFSNRVRPRNSRAGELNLGDRWDGEQNGYRLFFKLRPAPAPEKNKVVAVTKNLFLGGKDVFFQGRVVSGHI